MGIEYYDFREHVESIEWINQLPSGLVHQKIDIRYNTVSITKKVNGYEVYIGPKDPDSGGDAILILLDKDYRLMEYEIERLEPWPIE
jgi:hypothetical protein